MNNPYIDKNGNKKWLDSKGFYHRDDGPALEYIDGTKFWYQHGEYHREDGPAYEGANGTKEWYIEGKWIK